MSRFSPVFFGASALAALSIAAPVPAADRAPAFSEDIAPLLQRCQQCHRPGQIGPMPLRTYEEIRPFAIAIREAVSTRRMPPWFADPRYGDFRDDPSFTDEEIRRIVAWIDAGAVRGDPAEEPAPLGFASAWTIEEPDLVLTMPTAVEVSSRGEDRFVRIDLETGLKTDRWVKAVEIRPGDRRAVHHALAYVLQREERDAVWSRQLRRSAYLLNEYSAGDRGNVYPEGVGRLLEAGAIIQLEVHYHPYGASTRDRTSIALDFYDGASSPGSRVVTRALADFDLRIPAGDPHHRHVSETRYERSYRLLSFQPHMHFRGKSMRLEAVYADGREETLISIPRYDFYWQQTYAYREPPLIPAGTTLRLTSVFDNSAANPRNPDPASAVRWGDRAVDEMAIGWVDLVEAVEPGRAAEPNPSYDFLMNLLAQPDAAARGLACEPPGWAAAMEAQLRGGRD